MPSLTRRAALLAPAPFLIPAAPRAFAAATPPQDYPGTYALPDGQAAVSATLATSRIMRTTFRDLDVVMAELGTGRPVTRYETELTKQLHVIAISNDLQTFLHEHGDRPDAGGHFMVQMPFPHDGRWHIYADAVPAGLGQQVFRFEVNINDGGGEEPPVPGPTGLEARNGRYAARFESLDLRAGQESELRLRLLRDGTPAPDLSPYLGVAAHAVLIALPGKSYLHAHAAPAAVPSAGGAATPMRQDMPGGAATANAHAGHGGGHGGNTRVPSRAPDGATRPGATVPPDLVLHVRPVVAGTSLLWLQFMAGGGVRTVRFVVAVT